MFIDRATIFVRSGKGGDGCVSLRREKYVPKGGPDGGDGGKGGDVVLRGDSSLTTLLPVTIRPHYRAKNGGPGMGKSKHGADGADLFVAVPLGTLVYDAETGALLADISNEGEQFIPVSESATTSEILAAVPLSKMQSGGAHLDIWNRTFENAKREHTGISSTLNWPAWASLSILMYGTVP